MGSDYSTINELTSIVSDEQIEFNLFESAITGMIQQLKIVTTRLPDDAKRRALAILDKVGLAEYKKLDLSFQTQAIFSELLAQHNKSEKLHEKAKTLFQKDKSYSPRAIEGMAKGETLPSKWLIACAIELLFDEKQPIIETIISEDDLFMLWAKPLLDHGFDRNVLASKRAKLDWHSLKPKLKVTKNFDRLLCSSVVAIHLGVK